MDSGEKTRLLPAAAVSAEMCSVLQEARSQRRLPGLAVAGPRGFLALPRRHGLVSICWGLMFGKLLLELRG
jgi:hypothetical protein